MTQQAAPELRFVVCVRNDGYEASVDVNKIYAVLPDAEAELGGEIRVIDESGEDYLYPSSWFSPVDVPAEF